MEKPKTGLFLQNFSQDVGLQHLGLFQLEEA